MCNIGNNYAIMRPFYTKTSACGHPHTAKDPTVTAKDPSVTYIQRLDLKVAMSQSTSVVIPLIWRSLLRSNGFPTAICCPYFWFWGRSGFGFGVAASLEHWCTSKPKHGRLAQKTKAGRKQTGKKQTDSASKLAKSKRKKPAKRKTTAQASWQKAKEKT